MGKNKILFYKAEIIMYSILVLALFLFIIASIWVYYDVDKGIGENLFTEILGIAVTVIIIDSILSLKDWFKWKKIESKVMENFVKEINNFFIDFSNIIKMNKVVCAPDDSDESFNKEINKSFSKQIDEIADSDKLELDQRKKDRLIKGHYGNLFAKRYEIFNNFEIKYQKYLKPDLHIAIIDIQEQLRSIDLNISLQTQGKNWISEAQFYEVMADRFLKIAKAMKVIKDHGYLKTWM